MNRVALAASVFTGAAALFGGLSWWAAERANDNMIEQEIYTRQLDFCSDYYREAFGYYINYAVMINMDEAYNHAFNEGAETQEFLDGYNNRLRLTGESYLNLSTILFEGEMFLPEKMLGPAQAIQDDVERLSQVMAPGNFVAEKQAMDESDFKNLLEAFSQGCQTYVRRKELRLP